MRAVLDTNVIISGLVWGGPPGELIDVHIPTRTLTVCTSPPLLAELTRVLRYPHLARRIAELHLDIPRLLATVFQRAEVFRRLPSVTLVAEDPTDNVVLATAFAAQADAIISGDRHLLQLEEFRDIPILTARETVERLHAQP